MRHPFNVSIYLTILFCSINCKKVEDQTSSTPSGSTSITVKSVSEFTNGSVTVNFEIKNWDSRKYGSEVEIYVRSGTDTNFAFSGTATAKIGNIRKDVTNYTYNATGLAVKQSYTVGISVPMLRSNILSFRTATTPTVNVTTSASVNHITAVSANLMYCVEDDGYSTRIDSLVETGMCYSTSPMPTINDMKTIMDSTITGIPGLFECGDGSITSHYRGMMNNLKPSTTYYARPYAKNRAGMVGYGSERNFTTIADYSCFEKPIGVADGSWISSLQIYNDKLYITGSFTSHNGYVYEYWDYIFRTDLNGTLDTGFRPIRKIPVSSPPYNLSSTSEYPFSNIGSGPIEFTNDGKVLVSAREGFGLVKASTLFRLNKNGSFDRTFATRGGSATGTISSFKIQKDGKILVVGSFTSFDGTMRRAIVRLNPDGPIDQSFNYNGSATNIKFVQPLSNGKILIVEQLSGFDILQRLNSDGSIDMNFKDGTTVNRRIGSVALQADKILISESSNATSNTFRRISRQNENGSLDNSFQQFSLNKIYDILATKDGKILLYYGDGSPLIKLNSNGSVDNSFTQGTGFGSASGVEIVERPDGKLIVGGYFKSYNGKSALNITSINGNGTTCK
jgi:uncharacterized delta-60 repeat protein